MQLKKGEASLLESVLADRFHTAKKTKLGDLEPGSIIISRYVEKYKDELEEVVYTILVTFRKNKKDTRCAAFDGYDHIEIDYVLKNDEEVVHLITWGIE
jgi:hypothetical protein